MHFVRVDKSVQLGVPLPAQSIALQGNLSWALPTLGYNHPGLTSAYEWMARTVSGEGIAPKTERNASVRFYAAKSGPNFACGANLDLPCAWGATKVMIAMAQIPREYRTPLIENAIQSGIEFLFSVNPAEATYPSGMTGKRQPELVEIRISAFLCD